MTPIRVALRGLGVVSTSLVFALAVSGCATSWNSEDIRYAVLSVKGVLAVSVDTLRDQNFAASGIIVDAVIAAGSTQAQSGRIANEVVFAAVAGAHNEPRLIKVRVRESKTGVGLGEVVSELPLLDLRDPMRSAKWPERLVPYLDTISLNITDLPDLPEPTPVG